jgi:hypothetical protein
MPDWRRAIRARLSSAGLDPIDEIDIVEELAQHIEDRYGYLKSQGWTDAEAEAMSLQELDADGLVQDLIDALRGS